MQAERDDSAIVWRGERGTNTRPSDRCQGGTQDGRRKTEPGRLQSRSPRQAGRRIADGRQSGRRIACGRRSVKPGCRAYADAATEINRDPKDESRDKSPRRRQGCRAASQDVAGRLHKAASHGVAAGRRRRVRRRKAGRRKADLHSRIALIPCEKVPRERERANGRRRLGLGEK